MKYGLFPILLLFLLTSCGRDEKSAKEMLNQAQTFYESGEYASAKLMLDSLKTTYPKEIIVLKDGLQLMRSVELSEQQRNLQFSDSMLVVRQKEAEEMKKNFLFEKDKQYDDFGKFFSKHHVLEQNLQRSYLRCGVNEIGDIYMASVYYGKSIKHNKVKVTAPDGSYAETLEIPYDGAINYRFTDGGVTTEVVTYQNGKDNGVIQFICNYHTEKLKIEYIGEKNYSMTIRDIDKKALVEVQNLSIVLTDIETLKKEIEKSKSRIEYLTGKIQK